MEYRPFVPIVHGLRVGTAILSYNGSLFFGVTGDYETMPDVAVVAIAAVAGIEELRDHANIYLTITALDKPRSTDQRPGRSPNRVSAGREDAPATQ